MAARAIPPLPTLRTPGVFVTATDTGVGKTVVTAAIAAAVRRWSPASRVGVCKPMSSGCRRDREGLVHPDAEALAHFADCRLPLATINPIRFAAPLAPAVAAAESGQPIDWSALARALGELDRYADALLVEGVGGIMVPLDPARPRVTVLDLIARIGYPVVIVARPVLGTLNHTAMTARLLEEAGCPVAGIVINGFDADPADQADPSVASNHYWLEKMTRRPVLAVAPRAPADRVRPERGRIDGGILDALAAVDWSAILRAPGKR